MKILRGNFVLYMQTEMKKMGIPMKGKESFWKDVKEYYM